MTDKERKIFKILADLRTDAYINGINHTIEFVEAAKENRNPEDLNFPDLVTIQFDKIMKII